MKRCYVWLICLVVCIAFIALLYLQSSYAKEMVKMREEQFNENVLRSLDQASRDLEKAETFRYLQEVLAQHKPTKWGKTLSDSIQLHEGSLPIDTLTPNMSLGTIGKSKYSLVIFLIRQLSINIPILYLIGKYISVDYMWGAFVLSEILAMIVALIFMKKIKKEVIEE